MSSYEMQPPEDGRDFDDLIPTALTTDQSLADSFDDDDFQFEYDLISDFDPDLHQSRYEAPSDYDALTVELRIDELIAGVDDVAESERSQIFEMLVSLESGQLRYWLPRLWQKSWSSQSLLLFLEFKKIWDGKEEWWEATYWDRHMEVWRPVWSRYTLTLEDTYLLVQRRLHCAPGSVIEEIWFEEWEETKNLWQYGYFLSFAKFAVSRAAYQNKREWIQYLNTIK